LRAVAHQRAIGLAIGNRAIGVDGELDDHGHAVFALVQ
jgi:hypothetical protein